VTALTDLYYRTRSSYPRAGLMYAAFMAAWIYGFADLGSNLPGIAVFVLLLLPTFVHVGVGFTIGRNEALYLAAFPPALALFGPALDASLWPALVMLMLFPGAPLILLGIFLRNRYDPEEVDEDWF
jgi:hypothetical protein